jgi:pimeloyl-ACP methyl ester carboxylesterase
MSLITLRDGRDLEVEVSGPDGGPVLLFCHGTPGASGQFGVHARAAAERGLRFVTWSRAGGGAAPPRGGRGGY